MIGISEREGDKGLESLFKEIIFENFSSLEREIDTQVTEAQRAPNKRNPKKRTPRHRTIKMAISRTKRECCKH